MLGPGPTKKRGKNSIKARPGPIPPDRNPNHESPPKFTRSEHRSSEIPKSRVDFASQSRFRLRLEQRKGGEKEEEEGKLTNNGEDDGGDHDVEAGGGAEEMSNRLNESHGNSNSEGDEELEAEDAVNLAYESPTHLGILLHVRVELLPVPLL